MWLLEGPVPIRYNSLIDFIEKSIFGVNYSVVIGKGTIFFV